jgi:hypothetical protein
MDEVAGSIPVTSTKIPNVHAGFERSACGGSSSQIFESYLSPTFSINFWVLLFIVSYPTRAFQLHSYSAARLAICGWIEGLRLYPYSPRNEAFTGK